MVLGPDCAPQILEETRLLRESRGGRAHLARSAAGAAAPLLLPPCLPAWGVPCHGYIVRSGKGYHLEISSSSEDYAKSLNNFMNKLDLAAKMVLRRERYVGYKGERDHCGAA